MLHNGVPSKKILLGIPVFGRAFPGTNCIDQDYKIHNGEEPKEVVFDYRDLPRPGTEEQHDNAVGAAAFCVDGEAGFITYDSPDSVRLKAKLVSDLDLAGLFYWHIAADSPGSRSLVATGYNSLHEL